jgi:L-ascorbate metabolism protein UlaG (beta-lactamase superfamily)
MILKSIGKDPKNTKFSNIEPTEVMPKDASYIGMLKEYASKPKLVAPSRALPTVKTDLLSLSGEELSVIWFGHSSYLINHKRYTVLVDPVLFGPASPVSFYGKGFKGTTIYTPEELPEIDLLLITHDHYDHLSYETVLALKNKVKKIIVPKGVASHFIYWGFDAATITELKWNESVEISPSVAIATVPARHFSGRFLSRNKTLWTSYILTLNGYRLFIGGDSGYSKQFKITGDAYGPFDVAFVECGQYGKDWPLIHMFPEQTAQAAIDLKAKILFPVHWAKFTLALHQWNDPIKRLLKAISNTEVVLPMIGEQYILGKEVRDKEWWNFE